MFTRTPKTVDGIVSSLTKTLEQLDELTSERETLAEAKAQEADRLMKEAMADRQEAHRARRVASNITELLS